MADRHWSAGHQASWEDSDRRSRGLLSFLLAAPYAPLVTREQVLEVTCTVCRAQPGQECGGHFPHPLFAGIVLRGMNGVHLRRYQDVAHDPR